MAGEARGDEARGDEAPGDEALAEWVLSAAFGPTDSSDGPQARHVECLARYVGQIDQSLLNPIAADRGAELDDPVATLAAMGLSEDHEIFARALYCVSLVEILDGLTASGVDLDPATVDCLHANLSLDDIAGIGLFGSQTGPEVEQQIVDCFSDELVDGLLDG